MEWIEGGVVAAKGYTTFATASGIKKEGLDLAVLYSEAPCAYAGVFTRNVVKAAPVVWNMKQLEGEKAIRAVVINSGNANACTGAIGLQHVKDSATYLSEQMGITVDEVLSASTGVIGVPLPIETLMDGLKVVVPKLSKTIEAATQSARAIMTTDTYEKQAALLLDIGGSTITLGGMAKGSGMIHPNMGTMLSFITTDACIDRDVLQQMLKEIVDDTYNMISVDGDTSTNDMVTILANGCAGNAKIEFGTEAYQLFKAALFALNEHLAKRIAGDGEGATKLIEVQVDGLKAKEDARKMVHALISSNLVKTAFYGENPNWGRLLCAMGYSEASFDPSKVDLTFQAANKSVRLMDQGAPANYDESYATKLLSEKYIKVIANCNDGEASAKGWGCDLSHDYIKINGSYRT